MSRGRSTTVFVACAGQFLVVLDASIVNVALPQIQSSLALSAGDLSWVVNGYAIAFAGFLLLGGRAGDLFGRRRTFATGLVVFTAASLLAGLAPTAGLLLAARVLQGIGGAIISPSSLALITARDEDAATKAKSVATWSAVGAVGGAAGSLLGGVLSQYLTWRSVFLINIPVGILVFALLSSTVRDLTPRARLRSLDIPGAVLISASITALVYAVLTSTDPDSGTSSLVGLGAFAAATGAYVLWYKIALVPPLIDFKQLSTAKLWTGNVLLVFIGSGMLAMWFLLSLYLQNVAGYSPIVAGLAFIPHTLAIVVTARLAGKLVKRTGTLTTLLIGGSVGVIGWIWQAQLTPQSDYATGILLPGIIMSAGFGLSIAPAIITATQDVPPTLAGAAAGLANTSRQLGAALGLGGFAAIASVAGQGRGASALTAGYDAAFYTGALVLGVVLLIVLVQLVIQRTRPSGKTPSGSQVVSTTDVPVENVASQ